MDALSLKAQTMQRWAAGRRLEVLLRTLPTFYPHIFPQTSKARPWEPKDGSTEALNKAYKRATTYVHPDRLHGKPPAVIAEAQEILKVLTMAHASPVTPEAARSKPHARPSAPFTRHDTDDFVVPPYVPKRRGPASSPRSGDESPVPPTPMAPPTPTAKAPPNPEPTPRADDSPVPPPPRSSGAAVAKG
eukprot:7389764-Prymnesium_polylepis.1